MTHMVTAAGFNGPLELLLDLSERRQIQLTEVSVGQVARDYLNRLKGLSGLQPDDVADFLRLGCRLTYIKSAALLPLPARDESAQELRRLTDELAEYRRFRAAAVTLGARSKSPSFVRPRAEAVTASPVSQPGNVTLEALRTAFEAVMARQAPASIRRPNTPHIEQAEARRRLEAKLEQGPFTLDGLLTFASGRLNVIMLFSALLELIRDGRAHARHDVATGPIMIEPVRA